MTNQKDIFSYLVPGKCAHLAGIGGVSMSPLAEVLHGMGLKVQGSDMNDGPSVEHLRSLGIPVAIGHAADNLGECDFVIRTAAIHAENPEISGAIARGIPVYERAQAWGYIMRAYKNAICVSGTHGKTTTSTLVAWLNRALTGGGSAFLGGISKNFGGNLVLGDGPRLAVEADEFDRSFLRLWPDVAVVSSADADHLDIYGTHEALREAFSQFVGQIREGGALVVKQGCLLYTSDAADE